MDVVVVGSCNIDTYLYLDSSLPRPGETVHGSKLVTDFGGKGANQIVQATRLGVKTALVAKLGSYILGHDYLLQLNAEGVDTSHVTKTTTNTTTGSAYITVDKHGQNTIVVIPGANACLAYTDIDAAKTTLLSAQVVVFQLETPIQTTLYAMRLIQEKYDNDGPLIILNSAPCEDILPAAVSELVDILIANEPETECLTGVHIDGDCMSDQVSAALTALLQRARLAVIITLGSRGCALAYRDQGQQVDNIICKIFPAVENVKVVDTVGAGDAFVGSFAAFIARGAHVEDACVLANKVAAVTVAIRGAQSSYPTREGISDSDIHSSLDARDCRDRQSQFSHR